VIDAQELFRLLLRDAVDIPLPREFTDFYLYNWGDYFDGFKIAFLTNCLGHIIVSQVAHYSEKIWGRNNIFYKFANIINKYNTMNVISGVLGSAAVVFAETTGFMTTPDPKDIPAGILGALTYMTVRYLATRQYNSRMKNVPSYQKLPPY